MSSKKNIIIPMGMPPQKQEAVCCQRIGTLGLLYVGRLFFNPILMKLLSIFGVGPCWLPFNPCIQETKMRYIKYYHNPTK
jgi:hypothetical protein